MEGEGFRFLRSKLDDFLERNDYDHTFCKVREIEGVKSKYKYVTPLQLMDLFGEEKAIIYMVKISGIASNTSKKRINHTSYHLEERSAAKDVDMVLIKNSRPPINILKRRV